MGLMIQLCFTMLYEVRIAKVFKKRTLILFSVSMVDSMYQEWKLEVKFRKHNFYKSIHNNVSHYRKEKYVFVENEPYQCKK